jgi:carbamoyltransferase|tara:strand:- start:1510 stop:2931 length:1422 start_codon:yes stop_codon:yes gene_type:complete
MRILGISEGSHDAAWCLIEDGEILEAHHQERHDRKKNSKWLDANLLPKADVVVGHQILANVNSRRKWSGQEPIERNIHVDYEYNHHETHAWAGWATSPFDDCDILTMDAVGEWETATVHQVRDGVMKQTWGMKYPKSYGMPYSYITKEFGYKPMQDEYIVMAMAALGGRYNREDVKLFGFIDSVPKLAPMFQGSCHIDHWLWQRRYENAQIKLKTTQDCRNIARNVQDHYEYYFLKTIQRHTTSDMPLVIMGGCALNCVANSKASSMRDNIWIMPNPGDAGSALGAAARHYGKKLNWKGPYLGTEVPRMNPQKIIKELLDGGIAAVCSGRAEFGPRALGNRSLLADPRGNQEFLHPIYGIKKREETWRPFAPAILSEHFEQYFTGHGSEYMQFTPKHKSPDFKLVEHVDRSARVQVVTPECDSILREVLELWYAETGCPMLLNTSLNVKGEPIVNTMDDYKNFIKWSGLNDLS